MSAAVQPPRQQWSWLVRDVGVNMTTRSKAFSLVLLASRLLIGCATRSSVEQLQHGLGDYRFVGLTPRLKVTILLRDNLVRGPLDPGCIRVKGELRQTAPFPVEEYQVYARLHIKSPEHAKEDYDIGDDYLDVTVKNGVGEFSLEVRVKNWITDTPAPNAASLVYEFTGWGWAPGRINALKPEVEIVK